MLDECIKTEDLQARPFSTPVRNGNSALIRLHQSNSTVSQHFVIDVAQQVRLPPLIRRTITLSVQLQMNLEAGEMFVLHPGRPSLSFSHDGRKSTGVTNNINDGCVPLRSASFGGPRRAHAASLAWLTGTLKRN